MAELSERPERTWEPNRWPAPDEWVAWFLSGNDEQRAEIAVSVIANGEAAHRCLVANHDGLAERTRAAVERALREFPEWVATNRAYNGSEWPHGQSLYNECLNAVLSEWAADYLTDAAETPRNGPRSAEQGSGGAEGHSDGPGPQTGVQGVGARNLAIIKHEAETPMRGHDEDGECCRRAALGADEADR